MSAGGRLVVFGTNMVASVLGQNKRDSFSSIKLGFFTWEYVGTLMLRDQSFCEGSEFG